MKKHLFTQKVLGIILAVLCVSPVSAQIESGLWFVENSIGDFRRETSKYLDGSEQVDETHSNVSFYPVIGYMAGEHIAFGVRMKTGFEKTKQEGTDQTIETSSVNTRNTLSLEPFMRIYFPTANYRTRPYLQLGVGKGYMSTRDEYTLVHGSSLTESEEYSRHDEYMQIDAELGLNYLLTPDVSISSGVGYYLMYGKFDYNVQHGGTSSAQQSVSRNGDSSRGAMLWRLGFALFF
jgi:outer membrane protein W